MILIPNTPYNNHSKAELKVFDALSKSFCEEDFCFGFHSLNITNNPTKLTSEADFVVLCKYGLFVLEVKGGGISSANGKWFSQDKHKKEIQIQNPFKQAKEAFYYISKKIKEQINIEVYGGFGVVFADCEFNFSSCEWDENIICDIYKLKNFEKYLKNLFIYWQGNKKSLDCEAILKIKQFLRPNFKSQTKISEYELLNSNTKQILCFGKAGSGKSILALNLAQSLKNSAFICSTKFLQNRFKSIAPNTFISDIKALNINKKRENISKFDYIIADEILDINEIKNINNSLNGGLEYGKWYFFAQNNNYEIIEYLRTFSPIEIYLDKAYRKAEIIKKANTTIISQIDELINSGYKKEQITILSPFDYIHSSAYGLKLDIFDSFYAKNFNFKNVTFAKIRDFVGFENDIIIAIDITKFDENYILAQSRAKSIFIYISKFAKNHS